MPRNKEKQRQIREIFKEPYPMNLLLTIAAGDFWEEPIVVVDEITQDTLDGLLHAITMLQGNRQEILRLRFKERQTYRAIAEHYGISTERIRLLTHEAMAKLRRPPMRGYIKYGKQGCKERAERIAKERENIILDPMRISVHSMGLSVRATNRLIAKGCDVVGDVAKLTKENIENISHLGKITRHEIAQKLESMGITNTAWSEFI